MVFVGIFWVINGQVIFKRTRKDIEKEKLKKSVQSTGRIDSDFEHDTVWNNELCKKYPFYEYWHYPRGRVLYEIATDTHIIFVDECIKKEEIAKVAKLFYAKKIKIEKDIHYSCAKCLHSKKLDW